MFGGNEWQSIHLFDVVEDSVASYAFFARGFENGGQFFPGFEQSGEVGGNFLFARGGRLLVHFGEDDAEWHAVLAEPLHEFEVDFLGFVAAVDEDEQVCHLLTPENVAFDDAFEAVAVGFASASVAVAGKIDDIPLVVDEDVVDKHGLTGSRRSHGETGLSCEHVDEG